jgi:hypothetical protein
MTRHHLQLALGDHVTALFLGGPVRAIAWGVVMFVVLGLAAGWWIAGGLFAAGVVGAWVWLTRIPWKARPW